MPDFEKQMSRHFSIFRGDTREVLDSASFQAFFQLDSQVKDGIIHKSEHGVLIELGMNFSKSSIEDKVQVLRDGAIDLIPKVLDGEAVLIFIFNDWKRIHIATDPFGLFPLFMHQDENSLTLSTDLIGVLLVKPDLRTELCSQSIIEFVSCHFIMENRTLFENVFRVAEGSFVQFDLSTNQSDAKEWLTIPVTHEVKDIDYWISEVSQKLNSSILKRISSESGTFLSGGMDSRVIVASIPSEIRKQMKAISIKIFS